MRTYLVFPPHWTATEPYLSCPALTAFLRQHGQEVRQEDANIEFFNHLLSEPFLRQARDELRRRLHRLEEKESLSLDEQDFYQVYTKALLPADAVVWGIEDCMRRFRDRESFYRLEHYYRANRLQFAALLMASALHHPSSISFVEYTSRYRYGSTQEVFQAVEDRRENVFIEFFEELVLPRIEAYAPDVLGISICSPHQIISAFTLASLVKRRLPGVHITAGGGYYTRMLIDPDRLAPFFRCFDSLVVYEGETALLRLVEELGGQRRLDKVPNLVYLQDGRVRVNQPFHAENVNELPTPTFDGFPLDRYLNCQVVIPYLTSRGCYWGKCAFCTSFETYKGGFRQRRIDRVLEDMRRLARECDSNAFFFVDQATSPAALRRISQALLDAGENFYWHTEARFERQLDRELLTLMLRSGCRKILFGLESGHQRVLDLMEKGNRLEDTRRILEDCLEVGMGVHLFLITGFPTETEEEADATVDFITGIRGLIDSPGFTHYVHPFGLEKDSKVGLHPERYDVTLHPLDPALDLTLHYIGYDAPGMPLSRLSSKKEEMQGRILREMKFRDYPINGPHNFLYLIRYGRQMPERLYEPVGFDQIPFQKLLELVPLLDGEVTVEKFKFFVPLSDDGGEGAALKSLAPAADSAAASGDRDASGRRLAQVGEQFYCYIGRTERIWLLTSRGQALLELADGRRTVREICERYEGLNPGKKSFLLAARDLKVFFERGALRPAG